MPAQPGYFMPILSEAGKRKLFSGSGQIGTVKGGCGATQQPGGLRVSLRKEISHFFSRSFHRIRIPSLYAPLQGRRYNLL